MLFRYHTGTALYASSVIGPIIDIIKALIFDKLNPSDQSLYDKQSYLLKVASRLSIIFSYPPFFTNVLTTTAITGQGYGSSAIKSHAAVILNTSKYLVLSIVSLCFWLSFNII